MTIAYWCVLIGALLPIVYTGVAKFSAPGFDNRDPRAFQARMQGLQYRAHAAHLNSFEAFPPFAAAVLMAHQLAVAQPTLDLLAMAWVGLRVAYGVCYMANWATLRSLVWLGAMGCWVTLFVLAAQG